MRKVRSSMQSGFTLIELIIVIVIIGILAAVAIPKLNTSSTQAICGVQTATLGALKSAWSIAYAAQTTPGSLPTTTDVAGQMSEPSCTGGSGKISCTMTKKDGTSGAVDFTATETSGKIANPSDITLPACV